MGETDVFGPQIPDCFPHCAGTGDPTWDIIIVTTAFVGTIAGSIIASTLLD